MKVFNEWQDGAGKIHTFTLADLPHLETVLKPYRPRLVYIDAIQSVLGGKVDANCANQLKALLDPLTRLAAAYRCAILASRHPAKPGQNNVKLIYRGANSMAIIGTARLGLFAEDHPPTKPRCSSSKPRAMLGPSGGTQVFSKAGGTVRVGRRQSNYQRGPGWSRPWARFAGVAGGLLLARTAAGGGLAWPERILSRKRRRHRFHYEVVKRAKKALGVSSRQRGSPCRMDVALLPFPVAPYPSPSTDSFDTTSRNDPPFLAPQS